MSQRIATQLTDWSQVRTLPSPLPELIFPTICDLFFFWIFILPEAIELLLFNGRENESQLS